MGPSDCLEVMEKKNILPVPGFERCILGQVARCSVPVPTEISRFVCKQTEKEIMFRFIEYFHYLSPLLVDFQGTTKRYNPEDGVLHNHHSDNLKSYIHNERQQ